MYRNALNLIFIIFIFLTFSCRKDTPVVVESKTSVSYLKAHDFYHSGKIEIKENYMPIYHPNINYENWEFIEIPSPSMGYIYKGLEDTPWIAPTFLSFKVDYNSPQDSITQRAYDLNYSYFVYKVNGFYISNGKREEIKSTTAKYLVHKINRTHHININRMSGYNQIVTSQWFGNVDTINKKINFEVYCTNRGFPSVSGKWLLEQNLRYGYKEPGDVILLKKIDNVVFTYYDR